MLYPRFFHASNGSRTRDPVVFQIATSLMMVSFMTGMLFWQSEEQVERETTFVLDSPADEVDANPVSTEPTPKDEVEQTKISNAALLTADDSMGMGWGSGSLKENIDAISKLTAMIRKRPSSNTYCKRAWVYYEVGYYKSAVKDATRAIRLNPKNALAYEARANAYSSLGQWTKAERDNLNAERYSTNR